MNRTHRRRLGNARIDRAIDDLIPSELRRLSRTHWTPIDVAVRAVNLLCPTKDTRILDVGSGVGKLCAIGALSSFGTWCGVEQHAALVTAARRLTRLLDVDDRTTFFHGDAFELDWSDYDALYLYNPFERDTAYCTHVARMERRLASLRRGVRVVTLHGFGGVMPASFELVYQEHVPSIGHDLVLWTQRSSLQMVS